MKQIIATKQIHSLLFPTLVLIVLLSSCKSKMFSTKDVTTNKELSAIFNDAPHFETLQAQIQISANGVNAKGDLRILKNREIYLSVQAFFIEVARLKVTPDSIIALDRFHRRYFADSFDHINAGNTNMVNFQTLQALFTNSIFLQNNSKITPENVADFRTEENQNSISLTPRHNDGVIFSLNKSYQLTQTAFAKSKGMQLTWDYSKFEPLGNGYFPRTMNINVNSEKAKVNSSLEFAKIELGKPHNAELNIPSRYAKVELSEILKLLTEL